MRAVVRPRRGSPFQAELLQTRAGLLGREGLVRYASVIGEAEAWLPLEQIAPLSGNGRGNDAETVTDEPR